MLTEKSLTYPLKSMSPSMSLVFHYFTSSHNLENFELQISYFLWYLYKKNDLWVHPQITSPTKGEWGSAKRRRYSISLFSKTGDKGQGGVKNIKKWVRSFMDGPLWSICIIWSLIITINDCNYSFCFKIYHVIKITV